MFKNKNPGFQIQPKKFKNKNPGFKFPDPNLKDPAGIPVH